MTEPTPGPAHRAVYKRRSDLGPPKEIHVEIDEWGCVEITAEALHDLLTRLGFATDESPLPEWRVCSACQLARPDEDLCDCE